MTVYFITDENQVIMQSRGYSMSGSLNKVQLIGNLGQDPEVRHTQDGRKVVTFSLATNESWRDKVTNERKDRTEWHRISIFNESLGGIAEQYLRKGAKVYLEGQLQTRKWTDQSGQEKYTTEVILQRYRGELTMLDGRGKEGDFAPSGNGQDSMSNISAIESPGSTASFSASAPRASAAPAAAAAWAAAPELDDDIPF
jgi:single-strand DNA-binding protein